jgi:hypothetical protein
MITQTIKTKVLFFLLSEPRNCPPFEGGQSLERGNSLAGNKGESKRERIDRLVSEVLTILQLVVSGIEVEDEQV